ncbi:MAG: DegV family protein [Chloroflexi bacterium]|nr:DegV family protein [Chloroflexota bacterium]
MPERVAVVTDSTADIPPPRAVELGIHVVPLVVRIDETSYEDGTELPATMFYEKLKEAKSVPSTSQPSVGAFQATYEAIAADEIVSIHISSKLSGTLNSARTAAAEVNGKRIEVVDSAQVSLSLGYVAIAAAEAAQAGATFDEVCALAQREVQQAGFYAVLDTLNHARRSGRIGFAQALLGSMLQVKPILALRAGEVRPVDRPRTMRKALERLAELTRRDAPFAYLAVPHADNEPMAQELAALLADVSPGTIDVVHTGATVGSHCGPGAVAACYLRKRG